MPIHPLLLSFSPQPFMSLVGSSKVKAKLLQLFPHLLLPSFLRQTLTASSVLDTVLTTVPGPGDL